MAGAALRASRKEVGSKLRWSGGVLQGARLLGQGCELRGRKEWRQSQSEEEVLELGFDERQRERPQRLSSWAVPSSALFQEALWLWGQIGLGARGPEMRMWLQ